MRSAWLQFASSPSMCASVCCVRQLFHRMPHISIIRWCVIQHTRPNASRAERKFHAQRNDQSRRRNPATFRIAMSNYSYRKSWRRAGWREQGTMDEKLKFNTRDYYVVYLTIDFHGKQCLPFHHTAENTFYAQHGSVRTATGNGRLTLGSAVCTRSHKIWKFWPKCNRALYAVFYADFSHPARANAPHCRNRNNENQFEEHCIAEHG